MAIFDLPSTRGYQDFQLMQKAQESPLLPKELVAGESNMNQTLNQISQFVGSENSIYINKLI